MVKVDLESWSGGFFDGEGCIAIPQFSSKNEKGGRYRLITVISNTAYLPISIFRQLWGGYFYVRPKRSREKLSYRGCVYISQERLAYVLEWNTQQSQLRFLQGILPYLQLKKPQAELGIQFIKKVNEYIKLRSGKGSTGTATGIEIEYRRWASEEMKRLNSHRSAPEMPEPSRMQVKPVKNPQLNLIEVAENIVKGKDK